MNLFEWITARATGEAATAFLGTQGDEWEMFLALIGVATSAIALQAIYNRQLTNMQ